MIWPILRRVGAAFAVSGAALLVIESDPPAAATGRPWLTALDRFVLGALVAGALLQAVVPKSVLVWLASMTASAVAGFALAGRPGRLESASTIAVALVTPLLLLLVVTLSAGSGRAIGLTVAIAFIAALGVVRAVVYEPFADVDCTGLCRHNPILVSENLELAHNLGLLAAAAISIVSFIAAGRAIRTLRSIRRGGSLVASAQLCAAATALVLGVDGARHLVSNTVAAPSDVTVAVLATTLAAGALIAVAIVVAALDPLRARRGVDRVARLLARADGASDVQTIFRKGLGDPSLRVGYWVDGAGYLDEDGVAIDTESGSRIELTSRGLPLAVVVHARDALSSELFTGQLGAHGRLAIHNESLTFELNRRVAEVARSRRRIVEVGDAERRRLERDLHDGAQQRLLALSFELRRGERAALAVDDDTAAAGFRAANALVQTALEQLRHLAHGIHPAILNGAGLHETLREFAASTGRAVSLAVDVTERIPARVESTVYGVLTAAIANTTTTAPSISVRRDGERISLMIDRVAELPQPALDRAEAVGGTWVRTEHGFEVALPCAW